MNITLPKISALLIGGFALMVSVSSWAIDIVLDEKAVKVPLPVGKEIIVTFPQAITHTELLDADDQQTQALRQLLRPDGVLMLKAGEAFGEARLVATQIDGNIVVLDLDAQVGAVNHQTINLILPKQTTAKATAIKAPVVESNPNKPDFLKSGSAMTKNPTTTSSTAGGAVGFNQMVQYGLRHYVGPARLIGKQQAKSVKVGNRGLKRFVRVWGNHLAIKPLKQWQIDGHYLTVLLVNNRSANTLAFDPRALRGRLLFAAALAPLLQPQGSAGDQTLWAVITAVPFNQAIQ